jgi:DNA polymerase III delta' subunit
LAENLQNAGVLPAFMDYQALGGGYALLLNELRMRRVSHAYLLSGPRGVGKATFSRVLAASLFCEADNKPCGHCDECVKVFSGNEPDITEVLSPDGKPISIDRIREAIALISHHAQGTGPRVVLIEPADKLTPAAQNCLLKSLEDPPSNVLFLLLAHESGAMLSTISSRCMNVKLSPWPDELLNRALLSRGYEPRRIHEALASAGGVIGQAINALNNVSDQSELLSLIDRALNVKRDADVVALSTALKDDRDGAEHALTALEQALHRALMIRTGLLSPQAEQSLPVRDWGENSSSTELTALIHAVFETRKRRQSQVNWQASIDRLLTNIMEAKTRWRQL